MISGSYPPDKCGVGDYASNLYNRMLQLGTAHDFYLLNSHELIHINQIESTHSLKWTIHESYMILRLVESIKPNIINVQFPTKAYRKSLGIINLIRLFHKKRYLINITLHEYSYSSFIARFRTNLVLRFVNKLIVVDDKYIMDLKKSIKTHLESTIYINVASNIPVLSSSKNEILDFKGHQKHAIFIGFFGFIIPSKGIDKLIDLFESISHSKNAFLYILAELNAHNKYHQVILNRIKNSRFSNQIIVTGYLDNESLSKHLMAMDIMIYPFKKGFSPRNTSVLVALDYGVKVISTKAYDSQTSDHPLMMLLDKISPEDVYEFIDKTVEIKMNEKNVWQKIAINTLDFLITNKEL